MPGRSMPARTSSLRTLVAAALAGTLAATYPLFVGRSLVAPGNGPTLLLYDQAPFTYGSTDSTTEDTRGADVGAMMWAVLPYTVAQREALAQGEWPLWNRYNANGQPLWGQGQTFILDPVHLLSLAIPDPALAMDLRFVAGRAIFALGTGIAVLLATGSVPSAALLAFVAPFVGHFTARLNHPAYFSIIYAPWVLAAFALCARAVTASARARATGLLACATWLQLVGSTPKEGLVVLAAVYLAGLVAALRPSLRRSEALGLLDVVFGAALLALLAGAPHWLVFLDTLSRSWTAYGTPRVELAGWPQAVAFVLGAVAPGQPFTGGHSLLILAAACAGARPRALLHSGLGIGALAALLAFAAIAFGVVPAALVAATPLLRNIHHVWDAFMVATVPLLLLLAGVGLGAVLDERNRTGGWRTTGAALLAAATCAWMVPGAVPEAATIAGLVSVAGAMLVVLALRWAGSGRSVMVGVGTAAAVAAGGLHLDTGVAAVDAVLMQPRHRADLTALSPALRALKADAGAEPFRIMPVESVLMPGTQAYWTLEGTGGPDALRLPEMDSLAEAGGLERTSWIWRNVLHRRSVADASRFLDMLNVRYLVSRADQVPDGGRVLPLDGADQIRVIARQTAWPRAYYTAGVHHHSGMEGFARLLRSSDGPFVSVDERDEAAIAEVSGLPEEGAIVPATGYALSANTTSFHVTSPARGVAVLAESFVEQDFQATINGRAVPYIRVNHGFKGVLIPGPGEWTVAFTYRPALWRWSWALAALGAGGLVALLLLGRQRDLHGTPADGHDRDR